MLYLFNTNIIPGEAVVRVEKITAFQASDILQSQFSGHFTSAIGHESTAAAFSEIIGQPVQVNRIQAEPQSGDMAISLKLKGRLPEGQILDRAALDEIGWELFLISFFDINEFQVRPL